MNSLLDLKTLRIFKLTSTELGKVNDIVLSFVTFAPSVRSCSILVRMQIGSYTPLSITVESHIQYIILCASLRHIK